MYILPSQQEMLFHFSIFSVTFLFFIYSITNLASTVHQQLLCFLLSTFCISWRKQVPMDSKVNLPVQSVKN